MTWLISLSAWGEYYRRKAKLVALPSINAALAHATGPIKFILHTDAPHEFVNIPFAGDVEIRPFTGNSDAPYQSYGHCDRMALESAPEDCNIALLPCDVLVSREFFAASEKRFAEGKGAIVASAARTLVAPENCPAGLAASELLDFSFLGKHRHPVSEGCFWGKGRNLVTWCLYFEGKRGIIARAFHLHPFAVVNNRVLHFDRETVDLDLLECFSRDEIHVVTDRNEMSFAEISGLEKSIPHREPLCVGSVVSWAMFHTTPLQRWLFTHRIVVQGTGEDRIDEAPCKEILEILEALG